MTQRCICVSLLLCAAFLNACDDSGGREQQAAVITDAPVLTGLVLEEGSISPGFSSDITSYKALVPGDVAEVHLRATAPAGMIITVQDTVIQSGAVSGPIALNEGATVIIIRVLNEKEEAADYGITVDREQESVVPNYSFELFDDVTAPDNWTMISAGDVLTSPEYAVSGERSAYFDDLTGSISGREVVSDSMLIDPERDLAVSVDFYQPEKGGCVSLKMYYYSDTNGEIAASKAFDTMRQTLLEPGDQWQTVPYTRKSGDIPADARSVRISIRARYDSDSEGTASSRVYMDDVTMTQ